MYIYCLCITKSSCNLTSEVKFANQIRRETVRKSVNMFSLAKKNKNLW